MPRLVALLSPVLVLALELLSLLRRELLKTLVILLDTGALFGRHATPALVSPLDFTLPVRRKVLVLPVVLQCPIALLGAQVAPAFGDRHACARGARDGAQGDQKQYFADRATRHPTPALSLLRRLVVIQRFRLDRVEILQCVEPLDELVVLEELGFADDGHGRRLDAQGNENGTGTAGNGNE